MFQNIVPVGSVSQKNSAYCDEFFLSFYIGLYLINKTLLNVVYNVFTITHAILTIKYTNLKRVNNQSKGSCKLTDNTEY